MKLILNPGNVTFDVTKPETTIGRADNCDWVIPSERLSRTHCIFYFNKDRMAIMDPGSKNGVVVDGVRIEPEKLVQITSNSMIMLANEFYLSVNSARVPKVEMIEGIPTHEAPLSSKNKKAGPVKRNKGEEEESSSKRDGKKGLKNKLIILAAAFAALYVAFSMMFFSK